MQIRAGSSYRSITVSTNRPIPLNIQHTRRQPGRRGVDRAFDRRERHAFAAQRYVAFALIQLGEPGVGALLHGLVFRCRVDDGGGVVAKVGVGEVEVLVEDGAPAFQADLGKVADDEAGFGQHFWTTVAVGGGVTDQGGVTAGHGEDAGLGAGRGLRDDAAETLGTFIPSVEPHILFTLVLSFTRCS